MTANQIEAAKRTLPKWPDMPKSRWTEEQRRLDEELACRSMINSCLTYGSIRDFWRVNHSGFYGDHRYADPFVQQLGEERVMELVAEQEADFAKAKVFRDVCTDSEGVSYNSVRWGDE